MRGYPLIASTLSRPTSVPALDIKTMDEEATYKLGESRSLARKAESAQSLLSHHPNETESAIIHDLWLEQIDKRSRSSHDARDASPKPVPMSVTKLQNTLVCQPQYRNRHQFQIFGGFLLKQTFELAFCCAANFSHSRPTFVSADPCTFLNPVPVGSVLYLSARIVYTEPVVKEGRQLHNADHDSREVTRVQVRVDSRVKDVEHASSKPTGRFHYTFTVPKKLVIMPSTY